MPANGRLWNQWVLQDEHRHIRQGPIFQTPLNFRLPRHCVISETYFEEEQFAPGVCEASYELEEGEVFPETEKEQIKFLEELNLDWDLIELD